MLALEEILCELNGDDMNEQGLPPGFRFHPTDEELITFYLATKVYHGSFCGIEIAEVDLNRCEPWELPDTAKMGKKEWYFFSLRDRKYPTGLRTNRATGAGYWKATGKDKEVYSASNGALLGMKKTLVFYKGRAPRGEKTKWVMHEYRLDGDFSYRHTCKEEWVICRIVHKSGEKKTQLYQSQSYHLMREAAAAAGSSGLPPLLEIPTQFKSQSHASNLMDSMHNPFQIHRHENDLKSLINPVLSQSNHFPTNSFLQPSFSPLPPFQKNTNPSPSHLFKSLLLSHQDFTSPTVPKQCKTEPNFSSSSSHFQLPDANLRWMDKIHHQNPFQNPLFLDVDSTGVLGFSAADTPGPDFQMMLDPASITVTGDSWPLDL